MRFSCLMDDLNNEVVVLLACHISTRNARRVGRCREKSRASGGVPHRHTGDRSPVASSREKSRENTALPKCHCSANHTTVALVGGKGEAGSSRKPKKDGGYFR